MCNPRRQYQVKPHPSPWFSAACAAAIVHKNPLFVGPNRINLLNLKSRQASNLYKRVPESAKLGCAD